VEENHGYILRISSDDWVDQVYELKKYYSGVMRSWKRETPILFAKKTDVGDSFRRCALSFKTLRKFEDPYPIKESILAEDPRKGSFLHDARLTEEQMDTILEAAEDYPGQTVSTDQQG